MNDTNKSSELIWQWMDMQDMSPTLLYQLMAFRESIFVVEQACAYQELDGRDGTAWHLLGSRANHVVACLRVLPPPVKGGRYRIGRVAVDESQRGKGLGREMVLMAEQKIAQQDTAAEIVLDAQTYLQTFYETLGYSAIGEEFMEDGIPHRPMSKRLESS